MSDVPRSVLLALWGTAVLRGRVAVDEAVAAVTGDDEPHRLIGDDLPFSADPAGPGLADWLEQLDGRAVGVRAVLPVPGDVLGVPGGPLVTGAALEAGEAVVTVPSGFGQPCTVLVPTVEQFGSHLDHATSTTWQSRRAAKGATAGAVDLPEAERALRVAVVQAAASIDDSDRHGWRFAMAGLARPGPRPISRSPAHVPAGLSVRALRVVESAVRIRAMVAEAGGCTQAWDDPATSATLRSLDTLARQALVAAATPRMDW